MNLNAIKAKDAYLILANGTVFKGKSFGCEGEVIGEIVFTTAMTGYEETLYVAEDGSYFLYTNGGEQSKYTAEKLTAMSKAKAAAWQKENA